METLRPISWPEGVTEKIFLDEYWQRKPLLLRQAFTNFDTPLPADELAGLSLEPDTTPRLITQDSSGAYHLEHGPFNEDRFASLDGNNWSLLVTDVEKHLPDMLEFLQPFQFLPTWRIDDLMISYAPVGASVGAHVDEYDVFLLQASGNRRWLIDSATHAAHACVAKGDLKLVKDFNATDEWELAPGDMLYLPPGMAHHGIASKEPCTTWSVGFRAPLIRDMVLRVTEMIAEDLPIERYRDGPLDTSTAGEITTAAVSQFMDEWSRATQVDSTNFSQLLGKFLTENGSPLLTDEPLAPLPHGTDEEQWLCKAPFSRMAWHPLSKEPFDPVSLFVDGSVYTCCRSLAIQLCTGRSVNASTTALEKPEDRVLLEKLYLQGCLTDAL